jgi:Flp pilus assembly pilin Flp
MWILRGRVTLEHFSGGVRWSDYLGVEGEKAMLKLAKKFWNDEQGLELSEYAVMAAIIIALTVATILTLKDQIIVAFQDLVNAMKGTAPA